MKVNTTQAEIDAFLASGRTITRAPMGASAIDASRRGNAFRDAARNGGKVLSDATISETFSVGRREIAHDDFHSGNRRDGENALAGSCDNAIASNAGINKFGVAK